MLALVAYSLKPVKFLAQQVPTILLFCDRRSDARLHGITTMFILFLFIFFFYLVCRRYNNLKNKKREEKTKKYIQCDRDMVTGHSSN